MNKANDPKYRRDYQRGWRASANGGSLESADRRGVSNAWYDGYLDFAAGREKWHFASCNGNCGQH